MKKIFTLAIALFCGAAVYGQAGSAVGAGYTNHVEKKDDKVVTDFRMDIRDLNLRRNELVIVTPYISSNDGRETVEFEPIVVAGNKKYKSIRRSRQFNHNVFNPEPQKIIRYKKHKHDDYYSFSASVPYESWMRNSSFNIDERVVGCTKCEPVTNNVMQNPRILPPAFIPDYKVSYVTPPAEQIKQRKEAYVSHIDFQVGKHTLLREFKDNAKALGEVDKVMMEITNDKDLTITEFTVDGYASPEGSAKSNQTLSENRAKAFLDYLKERYGWNVSNVSSEGKGEDWDGLYKAVEKSGLDDRDKILSIIKDTPDVEKRKAAIRALSGGKTYRTLLNDYYPPLRRIEYEIDYIARAFDVNEAREIMKTKPQHLSLNEMFLVANSYPKGSDEFKNVFDVAARMYPTSEFALINTAAIEIESGAYDKAIERLDKHNHPEALNNTGVAYIRKGDLVKAEEYFRRSARAGSADGQYNLDQLLQFKQDNAL